MLITKMKNSSLSNSVPLGLLVKVLKKRDNRIKTKGSIYGDSVDQGVSTNNSEGVEVPQVKWSRKGHANDNGSSLKYLFVLNKLIKR